jgi:transposase InsO family protein
MKKYSKEFKDSTVQLIINENQKVTDLSKDLNLKVKMKRRYKNTTNSNHNLLIASNILNRDFYASNSNEKYVGDIIYISTVIDLYSKKVIAWSTDDTMRVSLVNDALNIALRHRNP